MRRKYFFTVHEKYFFSLLVPICAPPCISSCNHAWQVRGSPIVQKRLSKQFQTATYLRMRSWNQFVECTWRNAQWPLKANCFSASSFHERHPCYQICYNWTEMIYIALKSISCMCIAVRFNQQSFRWDHMRGVGLDRVCNDPLDINPPVCRPPLTNR